MKIVSTCRDPDQAVVICMLEDAAFAELPAVLQTEARRQLASASLCLVPALGLTGAAAVVVCKPPDWQRRVAVRRLGGACARRVVAAGHQQARIDLSTAGSAAECFLTGFLQGAYRWDRYRPEPPVAFAELAVTGVDKNTRERVQALALPLRLARDLINTPTADLGPADFVAAAKKAIKGTGLQLRLLDAAECSKRKMGCIMAVGRAAAADRQPRLLILEWAGRDEQQAGKSSKKASKKKAEPSPCDLAFCGKGVCFDTGGLQIKPGKSMELMRKDMGGAATVLASMILISQARPRLCLRAYLPLVENAIDGSAFRPGDVLTAMNGTTIEVGHTDAEGRLVLADAMSLAVEEGAERLCTVATLTGAALVALGRIHVPIMATEDQLCTALETAAAAAGEKVWRLPLDEDHKAMVASQIAVLTNSAGPEAACITAGAFLAHFAAGRPFLHCDISPASFLPNDHDLGPAGATGVLVDSLARMALALA